MNSIPIAFIPLASPYRTATSTYRTVISQKYQVMLFTQRCIENIPLHQSLHYIVKENTTVTPTPTVIIIAAS